MTTRAGPDLRRSAILAAALSFVLPGLGHGWLGRFRRGLVLAIPVLLLVGFAIGSVVVQGRTRLLGTLLQRDVLVTLLVLDAVLLVWRSGAILDAFRLARRLSPRDPRPWVRFASGAVLTLLLFATVGMHVGLGYIGLKTYDTVSAVFQTPEPSPTPSVASGTPGPSAGPATPAPTPEPIWSTDGRLDVLLVGGDAGPGRASLRTDTMILLSVEVASGRAAVFGIPRNLENVPLPAGPAALFPNCDCYPDLLNSLFVFAMDHPDDFRGGEARGYLALQDAVGELVGRELDGMLVVTLQGFVRLVDALGGLDITTPYALYDSHYPHEDGIHHEELWIPAGRHHLNGHLALAFARSRHQDSDYDRMYRQQLVLSAMRRQICPGDLVLRIPELLDIARDSLWTNLPVEHVPDLLALGNRVRVDRMARHQFWPPEIPELLDADAVQRIRELVARPYPDPSPGSPRPSGVTPPPTPPTPGDGC